MLSIIIVSYNVEELLKKCIHSLLETVNHIKFEIIVVDNNSSDNTVQMLKNEFPDVIIIENKKNVGFAAANNQGIQISQGEYILLLNPDTLVLPEAINSMLHFMENNKQTGAIGCKILNPDGTLQSSCRNFPTLPRIFFESIGLHQLFSKIDLFDGYFLQNWDHNKIREVDSVKGACLMTSSDVLSEIGMLDENFFLFGEEVDLCKRIKQHELKVIFIPDAQIIHYGGQSTEPIAKESLIQSHIARNQFFKKYYGKIGAMTAKIIFGFGVFVRFIGTIPLIILGKDEKKLQAKKRFKLFYSAFKWYFSG